jgi:hypothetical protein
MQTCVNYENITRQNKAHRTAHCSHGTSSTMKHDGFHFDTFATSFSHNGINHPIKSSKFFNWWQLKQPTPSVMKVECHNVRRWYFTSLVPNVASIEINLIMT